MAVGALAGVGLTEFGRGVPSYDGGFLGDLAPFDGFLSLGRVPIAAGNIALEVASNAPSVLIPYGIPMGLALVAIRRSLSQES